MSHNFWNRLRPSGQSLSAGYLGEMPRHQTFSTAASDWLATTSNENTKDVYQRGLVALAAFLSVGSKERAAAKLLGMGRLAANATAGKLRASLLRRFSPGTARVRMLALKAFCTWARGAGLIEWPLEFTAVRHKDYRDTRGPDRATVRRLLIHLAKDKTAMGRRDLAIVSLLAHRGLRRGEVASLDVEHFDGERLWVAGKGKGGEREPLTLAPSTQRAVAGWLKMRGTLAVTGKALFVHGNGARVDEQSVYRMVHAAGRAVGVKLAPHQLRHHAATRALDETRGDIRAVQVFMRHSSMDTTKIYDDSRLDHGGRIAKILGRKQ